MIQFNHFMGCLMVVMFGVCLIPFKSDNFRGKLVSIFWFSFVAWASTGLYLLVG